MAKHELPRARATFSPAVSRTRATAVAGVSGTFATLCALAITKAGERAPLISLSSSANVNCALLLATTSRGIPLLHDRVSFRERASVRTRSGAYVKRTHAITRARVTYGERRDTISGNLARDLKRN